jgi:dihydroneopterin aldolase
MSNRPSEDFITLTGLRATGHHGVFENERRDGQDFFIDVTVWLDMSGAASGDDLGKTVHYGVLAEEIVGAVERDPVDLIETVAERIAATVLTHEAAQRVRVTLHKPSAPITVPFADVSVTITRTRPGFEADTGQRGASGPDAGQPSAGQPDAGQPVAGQPDTGQPGARQPGASGSLA